MNGTASRCQFSPDGRWLLAGSTQGARVWDAASGRLRRRFDGQCMATFSAHGRRLVTWGWVQPSGNLTARVWDATTLRPLGPSLIHTADVMSAAFSPDGRRVVTGSGGVARIWNAVSGATVAPPMEHGHSQDLQVAFSPDGRRVLTWSGTGSTLRLWDAATGDPVTPLLGHPALLIKVAFSPDGRWLATTCADGSVWLWDVLPAELPAAELLLQAQLQASRRIDATGGSVALTPVELRQAWHSLRSEPAPTPAAAAAETLAWHAQAADACEQRGEWAAALPHLTRLIQARSRDPILWARRGSAHAALGQWQPAAADLSRAVALGSTDLEVWRRVALARLALGDTSGYRQRCDALLRRFAAAQHPESLNRVAWTCALGPEGAGDPARPLKLAAAAAASDGASVNYRTTLGAALYRAGRLDEALARLNEAADMAPPGSGGPRLLWLALCHQRLGRPESARQWLTQAAAWRQQIASSPAADTRLLPGVAPWEERLAAHLLRREAGEALQARAR